MLSPFKLTIRSNHDSRASPARQPESWALLSGTLGTLEKPIVLWFLELRLSPGLKQAMEGVEFSSDQNQDHGLAEDHLNPQAELGY